MSRSLRRRSQRAQKSHRNAYEAPQIVEKLEQKQLLVGQVQAVVRGDNLFITGEESANQVDISLLDGNVVVRPKQGTRINGQRGAFVAFGGTDTVPGSIFIDMRQGDDTVIISGGIKVGGDVRVAGDQGDDTLGIDNAVIRDDLIFIGGAGDDNLSVEDSRVVGLTSINLSSGDDLIRAVDSEFFNTFRARGSVGEDSVVLDGADFRRHVQISLQDGDDIIDMRNSRVDARFRINTGRDDDIVVIDDSTFEHTSVFDLGAGADNFALGDGDGDNTDATPASGNVFKRAFVTVGGSGVDAFTADIDNEFRSARREGRFESDTFVGSTAGAIAIADGVADNISDLIDVELTATAAAGTNDLVFGSGDARLVTTQDETVTVTGVTDGGADLEFDTDGDGVFDDLTATADPDGSYSVEVPIVEGIQTIDVRNVDQTGETEQIQAERATGSIVQLETTLGTIDLVLFDDEAPVTVANFLSYFDEFGDNSIIHRNPDNFVIQGGDFTVTGEQVDTIPTDPPIDTEFDPDNSNVRGTLSTALLPNDPNSATSGWFINLQDNSPTLDAAQHTVFGRVLGGELGSIAVADAIDALTKFDVGLTSGLPDTPLQDFEETVDLTGTISIANGSVTAFGTGTQFTTELEVGDQFTIETQIFIVNTINGDDDLTVTTAAQQEFTDETATIDNTPDEDNYVVFSDISLLSSLAEL